MAGWGFGYSARKAAPAVSASPSRALTVPFPRPQNIQEHDPKGRASPREDSEGGHWTRVTEPVFVLFKKQIPITAKPPYARGNRGKWQQGAGAESENKRITEYNLPCKRAAERRKGKRRR